MRENMVTDIVMFESKRDRERIGDVVGLWCAAQFEQARHHRIHLSFFAAPEPTSARFTCAWPSVCTATAGLRARKTHDAARVAHQNGGHWVLIGRVQLFDDDDVGFGLLENVDDSRVQLGEPLFKCTVRSR